MATFVDAFAIALSLILSIGAQNAFVLRQCIKKEHAFTVIAIAIASDMILISIGVFLFAYVKHALPFIESFARYAGMIFLYIYGGMNIYAALFKQETLSTFDTKPASFKKVVLLMLTITWLNPHVYLDTVLLMSAVASHYDNLIHFWLGASFASVFLFVNLGLFAKFLRPLFKKAMTWKILNFGTGVLLISIAIQL